MGRNIFWKLYFHLLFGNNSYMFKTKQILSKFATVYLTNSISLPVLVLCQSDNVSFTLHPWSGQLSIDKNITELSAHFDSVCSSVCRKGRIVFHFFLQVYIQWKMLIDISKNIRKWVINFCQRSKFYSTPSEWKWHIYNQISCKKSTIIGLEQKCKTTSTGNRWSLYPAGYRSIALACSCKE